MIIKNKKFYFTYPFYLVVSEYRKGMIMLFRQNNYKTYLVDEFITSCMCSIYKEEIGRCEKFQIRKNPKPYKYAKVNE
jgi:hypothetical protein